MFQLLEGDRRQNPLHYYWNLRLLLYQFIANNGPTRVVLKDGSCSGSVWGLPMGTTTSPAKTVNAFSCSDAITQAKRRTGASLTAGS